MPAYKGTKELPNASNKQARDMFTSMQKDREAMAKGRPDSVQRAERGEMDVLKDKPKTKKFAKGGVTKEMPSANQMGSMNMKKGGKVKPAGKSDKAGRALVKKSADTMGRAMKFAKGGSIDGCAKKGKTKTTMVKMNRGGKMGKGC